jgi:hypothetical protein
MLFGLKDVEQYLLETWFQVPLESLPSHLKEEALSALKEFRFCKQTTTNHKTNKDNQEDNTTSNSILYKLENIENNAEKSHLLNCCQRLDMIRQKIELFKKRDTTNNLIKQKFANFFEFFTSSYGLLSSNVSKLNQSSFGLKEIIRGSLQSSLFPAVFEALGAVLPPVKHDHSDLDENNQEMMMNNSPNSPNCTYTSPTHHLIPLVWIEGEAHAYNPILISCIEDELTQQFGFVSSYYREYELIKRRKAANEKRIKTTKKSSSATSTASLQNSSATTTTTTTTNTLKISLYERWGVPVPIPLHHNSNNNSNNNNNNNNNNSSSSSSNKIRTAIDQNIGFRYGYAMDGEEPELSPPSPSHSSESTSAATAATALTAVGAVAAVGSDETKRVYEYDITDDLNQSRVKNIEVLDHNSLWKGASIAATHSLNLRWSTFIY